MESFEMNIPGDYKQEEAGKLVQFFYDRKHTSYLAYEAAAA